MNLKEFININNLGLIIENENFKDYLTIKTTGKIKNLIKPKNIKSLKKIIKYFKKSNQKYFILGNGSNIYTSSKCIIDNVIYIKSLKKGYSIKNEILYVSASYLMSKLAYEIALKGYKNLEYFSGIPGTVGGIIYMNAGAYKNEIMDYIISVTVIDEFGNLKEIKKEDINYNYRKTNLNNKVIVNAKIKLTKTKEDILNKILEWKKYRLDTQPLNYPTFGSVFKNTNKYKAWEILDYLGYRGYKINDIMVSFKHSNFIINLNNGKGEDIFNLINIIKDKAFKKLNIILEEEVIYLG